MIILGLTGSIGMGKTTAAENFRRQGVPVHDADRTVHELLAKNGEAVELIEKQFPGSEKKGAIDREKIAGEVFNDPEALARIESILHPMVRSQVFTRLKPFKGLGRPSVQDRSSIMEIARNTALSPCVNISLVSFNKILGICGIKRIRIALYFDMTPNGHVRSFY